MASAGARRGVAIAVGLTTVVLTGIAAASGNPVATEPYVVRLGPDPAPIGTRTPPPGAVLPPPTDGSPVWLRWILDGFLLLLIGAIVVTLVVLTVRLFVGRTSGLIRRRVLEPEEIAALSAQTTEVDLLGRERELSDAVSAGIAALAAGTDVRAAVITAWLRLEAAAAEAGTPRRDDDAPADFVGRLLGAHDVRPRRLETLAELYRRARFSPAELDERDRDEARRALGDVRDDLVGAAAGAVTTTWGGGRTDDADGRWPTRWT